MREKRTNLGDFRFLVLSFDACRRRRIPNCSLSRFQSKEHVESHLKCNIKGSKGLWNQVVNQQSVEARLPLLFIVIALRGRKNAAVLIAGWEPYETPSKAYMCALAQKCPIDLEKSFKLGFLPAKRIFGICCGMRISHSQISCPVPHHTPANCLTFIATPMSLPTSQTAKTIFIFTYIQWYHTHMVPNIHCCMQSEKINLGIYGHRQNPAGSHSPPAPEAPATLSEASASSTSAGASKKEVITQYSDHCWFFRLSLLGGGLCTHQWVIAPEHLHHAFAETSSFSEAQVGSSHALPLLQPLRPAATCNCVADQVPQISGHKPVRYSAKPTTMSLCQLHRHRLQIGTPHANWKKVNARNKGKTGQVMLCTGKTRWGMQRRQGDSASQARPDQKNQEREQVWETRQPTPRAAQKEEKKQGWETSFGRKGGSSRQELPLCHWKSGSGGKVMGNGGKGIQT